MSLRILHIIPGITRERGGPTAVLDALTRAQLKQGDQIQVLTTDQGESLGEHSAQFDEGVEVIKRAMLGPDSIGYAPAMRVTARSLCKQNDVIHIHSLFNFPTEIACRAASAVGKPFIVRPCGVLHPHGLAYRSFKKWLFLRIFGGTGFRRAAAIHCATQKEADLSRPQFAPVPSFVVPNGLDPEEFVDLDDSVVRAEVTREFDLPDQPYVLFLGRIHPIKGLETLLAGFAQGAPSSHQLVIAGPEEKRYGSKIRGLVDDLGLSERTHFAGPVYGRRKVALLAAADVFALSSLYESFGNVIVESLAAGTPVLLSNRIDLAAEIVTAGLGWSVAPTADAWANALSTFSANTRWREADSSRARAWAIDKYSWASVAERLNVNYRRFCLGEAVEIVDAKRRQAQG